MLANLITLVKRPTKEVMSSMPRLPTRWGYIQSFAGADEELLDTLRLLNVIWRSPALDYTLKGLNAPLLKRDKDELTAVMNGLAPVGYKWSPERYTFINNQYSGWL